MSTPARYSQRSAARSIVFAPRLVSALAKAEPETAIPWQRAVFRPVLGKEVELSIGRPRIGLEIRQLIRDMTGETLALQ
jgi:hypothetical protein